MEIITWGMLIIVPFRNC